MTSERARVAAMAGLGGVILGVLVTGVGQLGVLAQRAGNERQVIRPERAPDIGLPFSPGILVGNTLYVAGHLGRDPVTTELASGGVEAETRQALANIREVLEAADMDFQNVVSVTAYLTDFDDFPTFNRVYREFFPEHPPARATVQVAALNAGARVELQMVAVRPSR